MSGSAAALLSDVPTAVVAAPANAMPWPSKARRSTSPLPATGASIGAPSCSLLLRLLMLSSLLPAPFARELWSIAVGWAKSHVTAFPGENAVQRLPPLEGIGSRPCRPAVHREAILYRGNTALNPTRSRPAGNLRVQIAA